MLLQELSKYTPFVSSSFKNQGHRNLQNKQINKNKEKTEKIRTKFPIH